ncbi:MAG: hypothetical protein KGJ86_11830, partial [Chloroflexota bacterium]|nr:hypothetical protein [Chloroflexota bacterium]
MNDMQEYFVHEFVEEYKAGHMSRRDMMRRILYITGGVASAASLLNLMGCGSNAAPASSAPAPASARPASSSRSSQASSVPASPARSAAARSSRAAAAGGSSAPASSAQGSTAGTSPLSIPA